MFNKTRLRTCVFHIGMMISMILAIVPQPIRTTAKSNSTSRILVSSPSVSAPAIANTASSRVAESDYYVTYGQSKTTSSRTIVLNWSMAQGEKGGVGVYKIYRRVIPGITDTNVGCTGIAASSTTFANLLGPSLLNRLSIAMNNTGLVTDTLSSAALYTKFATISTGTTTDKVKAQIAAQKYPELANALGLAYTETLTTNLTSNLRYTIKKVNTTGVDCVGTETTVGSVTIAPDGATTTIPTPTRLSEAGVYDGNSLVGVINSTRPVVVPERYDTTIMQNEIGNDGKVYLTWNKGTSTTPNRMVAGYNVYRKLPVGVFWTKVNSSLVSMNASQPFATSTFTTTVGLYNSYYDNPYYFVDDTSGFSSSYRSWSYRVCAVDLAGTEGTCSLSVSAIKRDLIPPSAVENLTATTVYPNPPTSAPGKVRIRWTHTDYDRLVPNTGNLPTFFITRAITTGVRLANWTVIASNIAATNVLSSTYVFTDSPPLNVPYWYRVQVRDNAGNWSAISEPVKGSVYDRLPPAKPAIEAPAQKKPCFDKLMSRLAVPGDVRQVVLSRRLSQSGEWRIIRRLRPNTNRGSPRGVDIVDKYITPLPNTPVYYKIEFLDAYNNMSLPATLCVRGNSPNDLNPPRFTLSIRNNDNGGPRVVTIDFGTSTDIFSRSVVIARPTVTNPANVTTTTVAGNASTFQFQIDTGESLRVGAIATALTATTSLTSTLNSRWVRNVNNFLNLNITPSSTKFLDTPRNMANLGAFTVAWASANSESCRDTVSPPRKACAMISSRNYLTGEKPPMVALFRRLKPSGNMLASDVPWLQASSITNWTLRSGQYVVEDTTIMDPTRTYEYMAVAHSSTSFEVIGYFTAATLTGTKPGTPFVNIGTPVNTTTITQQLPAGCRITGLPVTAETVAITDSKKLEIPPYFFDENDELVNTFNLQRDFTFVAQYVVRSINSSSCAITNPATTNSGLYIIGKLMAGTRTAAVNVAVYNAKLTGPGTFVSTRFLAKFPPMAPTSIINPVDPDGLIVKIRDFAYTVDAAGVMTSTTALTVTLPSHIRMAVDTVDPLYSQLRSSTVVFHSDILQGNYDTDSLIEDLRSNSGFAAVAGAGRPGAVIVDEYAPWFYRASGITVIKSDVSGMTFERIQALSRTTYMYGSSQFTDYIPDNNSAFVGTYSSTAGGRNYVYDSDDTTINMKGLAANLARSSGVSYVTSYPAGVQISALSAAFKVANSVIYSGELITPTVRMKYISRDSDTSYARLVSGRAVFVRGNYLPTEFNFSYAPAFTTRIITLENDGILNLDGAGIATESVTTPDSVKWPGFTMQPVSSTVDMTLYLAPATPVGMSTIDATIPKPAESAWQQIDLGYSDESDLDPGINFNGQNSVNYGCYGTGVFDARMDTYLRYGGFSEHLILQGLGASVKNNTTGYDESLMKFSAIFADNVIVDPSDVESELNLPYPSDVNLPLDANVFDSSSCPVGGTIGSSSGVAINHKYWNFSQQALSYGYASGANISRYAKQYVLARGLVLNSTNLTAARAALPPVILQISGNLQPMAARSATNTQANISGVSEWLPNGEFGNITLASAVETYNSGMPFTLNDIILNRYNSVFLDSSSKPSTAGFTTKVGGLPSKLLDANGLLTEESLAACIAATSEPLGCGFQILDGNNALKYFGEPEKCTSSCVSPSGTTMAPLELLQTRTNNGDTPSGDGSIGSAGDGTEEGDTLWNPVLVQLMWDLGSPALDIPFPLVFIANKSGGVFAGMFKSQSILPGAAEVFKSDVSVVVNGRLQSAIFTTDIGIFFGYAASQAALRALSTHRPNDDNTGFKAHEPFSEVKDDVKKWSKTFGYGDYDNSNDNDDPVDMLEDLWTGHTTNSLNYTWGNARTGTTYTSLNDYQNVFNFLEPKLKSNAATESYDDATQGITALKQGSVLANACTTMKNGQGAVQFQIVGSDVNLQEIAFGSYVDVKNTASSSSCDTSGNSLLTIDRVTVKITGDGEITIVGTHIKTVILEKNVEFDVQLVIGTATSNQRIEGGIKLYALTIASVDFTNIGVVFGIGQYNSQRIGYFGFMGTGKFKGYTVSASFLFGMLSPSSAVLQAQYGSLMSKLSADRGAASVFSGVYISVGIEVPIYSDGCMREVKANGELRGWYFKQLSPPSSAPISWGGYISAGVYGEAACLVSARGQLSLELYESTGVLHFDGQAWLAGGVGDCEPNTWNSWGGRWWGDSWCAQAGAMVQVNYADTTGWDVDYDLAVEPLW